MSRLDDALAFAIEAHAGMVRKGDRLPYILHPLEVATIAATCTDEEDVVIAAALHDVVEDTPHTLDEIRDRFGDRVAELVASETEDKRSSLPASSTWLERKLASLEELRANDDRGIHALWLSDKLANMRSFSRLHEREGDAMWEHFNQKDPAMQAWYHHEVAEATRDLAETPAWKEFKRLSDMVFEGVELPHDR